jgi:hypothetical protein
MKTLFRAASLVAITTLAALLGSLIFGKKEQIVQ